MENAKRQKVHKPYFVLRGFQKAANLSDKYMGELLSCSPRTYNDKVNGWNDFTPLEARELARVFSTSQDVLFS